MTKFIVENLGRLTWRFTAAARVMKASWSIYFSGREVLLIWFASSVGGTINWFCKLYIFAQPSLRVVCRWNELWDGLFEPNGLSRVFEESKICNSPTFKVFSLSSWIKIRGCLWFNFSQLLYYFGNKWLIEKYFLKFFWSHELKDSWKY